MDVAETRRGNSVVLSPTGRIDSNHAAEFGAHLNAVIDRGDSSLLVDLAGVDYISSAGLAALLAAAKKAKARQGRIGLCALNDRVRLVFEMSGFLALFPVWSSVDAAQLA
jgi:anti-anti-sigma factor